MLLQKLKEQVAAGIDKPCIQGNVLRDSDIRGLTSTEILSVSLSTMAGADTSQPTLAWTILLLSRRPDIQRKAYRAIVEADRGLIASPEGGALQGRVHRRLHEGDQASAGDARQRFVAGCGYPAQDHAVLELVGVL